MNVLVTGSNGFLGRHVVAALLRRSHHVRAMVRPGRDVGGLVWRDQVDLCRADLCQGGDLAAALDAIDTVIHLAAGMSGDEQAQWTQTVDGTRRLLEAMANSATKRLVLASSLSVYAWRQVSGTLTEDSPTESSAVEERDMYARTKVQQETMVRQAADGHGWSLTVLRPGAIWGPERRDVADLGHRIGPVYFVIAPRAQMRATHVENCADAFAAAAESDAAAGQTYNVLDGHGLTIWRYAGLYVCRQRTGWRRVPVPYRAGRFAAALATGINRLVFRGRVRLPGLLISRRFEARFKPVSCSASKLRDQLGWTPPYELDACIERTFSTGSACATAAEASVKPSATPQSTA